MESTEPINNIDEIRPYFLKCIVADQIIDAKLFINKYIDKYTDNSDALKKLTVALCGLPSDIATSINFERRDEIRRYLLSSLCLSGNSDAIHDLGCLYAGFDGDEMDQMNITETNITTAIMLFNLANSYQSCLSTVYLCTQGNRNYKHFDIMYPSQNISNIIKSNLIKALTLYKKPANNPNYYDDFGYIFEYVPGDIVLDLVKNHPEFSQHFTK